MKQKKNLQAHTGKKSGLKNLIGDGYSVASLAKVKKWLEAHGTHEINPIAHGLFSASSSQAADSTTGYQNVWIRDCIMIANSFRLRGNSQVAIDCVRGLTDYFRKHRKRFDDIIADKTGALKEDVQNRPHIRFSGNFLAELPEKWPHAQNDALGYALWLRMVLANSGEYPLQPEEWGVYNLFPAYFEAIEFWNDRDSGAWEEARKINSSSVGAGVAGLQEMEKLIAQSLKTSAAPDQFVSNNQLALVKTLKEKGKERLKTALPFEAPPERLIDGALLFLMYPLNLLESQPMQDGILHLIEARLQGPFGIRRYLGDSYFCQDYDKWFPPGQMSTDFSDKLQYRDAFLQPGCEAQWCIFDPVISIIYGQRFLSDPNNEENLRLQTHYFNRSLQRVTPDGKCPELYFLRDGQYVPNAHTPLGWTQANQALALHLMEQSVSKAAKAKR
jgi:phosphorylase kinase alpha/beta subunit